MTTHALYWLAAASALSGPATAESIDLLYTQESATPIPSTDSGWDYIKMEPGTGRLFMARDRDGLTVFDVDTNRVITTIDNSVGANGPLLLPQYNRGYSAMTDGSLLSFDLASLKTVARLPLAADGGINSVVHDPATKRIHAIVSERPAKSTWYTLDAATGRLLSKTEFPFRKMDDPAIDGTGRMFAPARHDKLILTLDSKTLKETGRWTVPCTVSKVRYQPSTNRVLAACLDDPLFIALDATTGREVARIPIGPALDGLVLDEKRGRVVTSSDDGTLTVIQQNGADEYALLGTVTTRVRARMMTIDERNGRLLVVAANSTAGPRKPDGSRTRRYHPNTFTVLTYVPQ